MYTTILDIIVFKTRLVPIYPPTKDPLLLFSFLSKFTPEKKFSKIQRKRKFRMKGKGRTVVIHPPRSIRRTFLGRVVSGRAGGGGAPPHRSDTSRGHLHPPLAPFPLEGRFSPISSLSFHPPRPISSVQRVLLSRAARLCRRFRRGGGACAQPPTSPPLRRTHPPAIFNPLFFLPSLVLPRLARLTWRPMQPLSNTRQI